MKIKRIFSVLLAFALMLTYSQSAFAITGVGDTRDDAYQIDYNNFVIGTLLDRPNDVDWYKITNYSNEKFFLRIELVSDPYVNYDLIAYRPTPDGEREVAALDQGQGKTDMVGFSFNPGDTVYFKVIGHNGAWGVPSLETYYTLNVSYYK